MWRVAMCARTAAARLPDSCNMSHRPNRAAVAVSDLFVAA
jgi:hypothetical protein